MQTPRIDPQAIAAFLSAKWDQDIVPQLVDYIRIPNKSPMFDKDWQAAGHMDAAVALMEVMLSSASWVSAECRSSTTSTAAAARPAIRILLSIRVI